MLYNTVVRKWWRVRRGVQMPLSDNRAVVRLAVRPVHDRVPKRWAGTDRPPRRIQLSTHAVWSLPAVLCRVHTVRCELLPLRYVAM